MSKCIVCECANILYYEPPKERPPLKCPNCGRDTRHYASMKTDDPRVNILDISLHYSHFYRFDDAINGVFC